MASKTPTKNGYYWAKKDGQWRVALVYISETIENFFTLCGTEHVFYFDEVEEWGYKIEHE